MNKFKGDDKRFEWLMRMHEKGKYSGKIPTTNAWQKRLIEFYSMTVKEDGISISDLKIVFDAARIKDNEIFYDTIITLNRCFNKVRGFKNDN